METSSDPRNPVEVLAEEFLERKRRGETPTLHEYLERYPDLADEIRELFPALLMIENLGDDSGATTGSLAGNGTVAAGVPIQKLGDYRIIREIGRGGMGVVYEAEQESLGRRVALKVMSATALVDPIRVRRFEREARAAAKLHHTNIVPVFGVGQQDGHYYIVMQFIPGLGLDAVLAELRRQRKTKDAQNPAAEGVEPADRSERGATAADIARSLIAGTFAGDGPIPTGETVTDPIADETGTSSPPIAPEAVLPADSSSVRLPGSSQFSALSDSDRRFYQSVARIGIQVAEALEYANRQGVLHRDVKPSNLLLDNGGNIWVADFGLAKLSEAGDLTDSRDILGTIRYMAPERFGGKCDARSDVYSLGLTLYELVALRPAHHAADQHALIERVLHEEPARLKKVVPTVPRDLDTIVMKAVSKEPAARYASAQALADDLNRFLRHEPIKARRSSALERSMKWAQRRPAIAALIALVALISTIGFGVSAWQWRGAVRSRERIVRSQEALKARLYIDQVGLALAEYRAHNPSRADLLLDECEPDRRGWEWHYLKRLRQGSHPPLAGSEAGFSQVAFSPDGRRIAARGLDSTMTVWDLATGSARVTLKADSDGFCFSPDGQLISASHDGSIRFWDAETGQVLRTLASKFAAGECAISPDGLVLATVRGEAEAITIWDVRAGTEARMSTHPGEHVGALAISPDGRYLAGLGDRAALVWELADRRLVRTLAGGSEGPGSVAFSPDGTRLAVVYGSYFSDDQGIARVWDLATGRESLTLRGHDAMFSSVAFTRDGQRIVTGGSDMTLRVWDATTGQEILALRGHNDAIHDLAFSPDGRRMASAGIERTIRIWDASPPPDRAPREQLTIGGGTGRIRAVAIHPDGGHIVIAGDAGNIAIHDTGTGKVVRELRGHRSTVWGVAYSRDGTRLASGDYEGAVIVWDLNTGVPDFRRKAPAETVVTVAIRPDGRQLVAGGRPPHILTVWDIPAGAPGRDLMGHLLAVLDAAYSADGRLLATSSADMTIRIWDAHTGAPLRTLGPSQGGHGSRVRGVAFRPDGRLLASVGIDQDLKLWDTTTWKVFRTIPGDAGPLHCVAFSPDGRRVAAGGFGQVVKVWDANSGRELLTLHGHTGEVNSLAFTPDGGRLVTGSSDQTVKIWDVTDGPVVLQ